MCLGTRKSNAKANVRSRPRPGIEPTRARQPVAERPNNRVSAAVAFVDSKAQGAKAQGAKVEAPPKPRSRTSTSYVPRAELMRRTLGIHVLQGPVCQATMVLLAVITRSEGTNRILTHVKVHSSFSFRAASRELLVPTILRLRRRERGAAGIDPGAIVAAAPRCG